MISIDVTNVGTPHTLIISAKHMEENRLKHAGTCRTLSLWSESL